MTIANALTNYSLKYAYFGCLLPYCRSSIYAKYNPMKIDRLQTIAGHPVLRIRYLFKAQRELCGESVGLKMGLPSGEGTALIEELEALGYLEAIPLAENPSYRKEQWWRLKAIGCSLALARAVPPMKRAKAERLLEEFVERVHEVNTNPRFLFKITQVLVFGSYLRLEVGELNDLDLAVEMRSKYDDHDAKDTAEDYCRNRAQEEGRCFSSYSAYLYWPETMVKLFLKNKSRYISWHSMYDQVLTWTETKQIYPLINGDA